MFYLDKNLEARLTLYLSLREKVIVISTKDCVYRIWNLVGLSCKAFPSNQLWKEAASSYNCSISQKRLSCCEWPTQLYPFFCCIPSFTNQKHWAILYLNKYVCCISLTSNSLMFVCHVKKCICRTEVYSHGNIFFQTYWLSRISFLVSAAHSKKSEKIRHYNVRSMIKTVRDKSKLHRKECSEVLTPDVPSYRGKNPEKQNTWKCISFSDSS